MSAARASDWSADVYRLLRSLEVRQVGCVPDAGLTRLIELCGADPEMRLVPLTTEEEGVALVGGAWLGGQRAVLLMQSSGVGNCVNMLSLARACAFPLLMIVTMRGEAGEANPWQVPMGRITADVLRLADAEVVAAASAEAVAAAAAAAAEHAFDRGGIAAVLVGQAVIGVKTFEAAQ